MIRIAYFGTYPPKKCGIATYTHHLRQSVKAARQWKIADSVYALTDGKTAEPHPDPAVHSLPKEDRQAYRKAAQRINAGDADVVSLQHEFGIFGGEAGKHVLELLERLDKPVVTTFHTVFEEPREPYASVQREIASLSDRIVVMNRKAVPLLVRAFDIPEEKIVCIPHGAPAPVPEKREELRERFGWRDRKVIMTFGLLSRGKGLELVIRALPEVIRQVPDALYAILGQTHPEVRKREGESYREELNAFVRKLGLENHVVMIDRYVDEQELVHYLTACDLYVTPYPGMQQITSGTLAYAVGLGRPVLTTPYSHAQDLLAEWRDELLLPFGDEKVWARRIAGMLSDPQRMRLWEERMRAIGAPLHWPRVGAAHAQLFREAERRTRFEPRARAVGQSLSTKEA
jgi:glycosyltransferase involved in cell wall biosynthesis